jgi:hypothetical protein
MAKAETQAKTTNDSTAPATTQPPASAPSGANTDETKPAAVKTVPMKRAKPQYHGGPTRANVHPDEVANWEEHGWSRAFDDESEAPPKK